MSETLGWQDLSLLDEEQSPKVTFGNIPLTGYKAVRVIPDGSEKLRNITYTVDEC